MQASESESVSLQVDRDELTGTFELLIPPGTTVEARDKLVDDLLTEPLFELARDQGLVLATDPHGYVKLLDGRDEQGRTRFVLHARFEGGLLVPMPTPRRKWRR